MCKQDEGIALSLCTNALVPGFFLYETSCGEYIAHLVEDRNAAIPDDLKVLESFEIGEKVYDILFDQRDDGNLTLFVRGPNREVYVERRMPAASMIPNVGKYEDGFETVCLIGLCTGEFCEGPECEVVGSCKQACKEV